MIIKYYKKLPKDVPLSDDIKKRAEEYFWWITNAYKIIEEIK